jgi:hypothetical protein
MSCIIQEEKVYCKIGVVVGGMEDANKSFDS